VIWPNLPVVVGLNLLTCSQKTLLFSLRSRGGTGTPARQHGGRWSISLLTTSVQDSLHGSHVPLASYCLYSASYFPSRSSPPYGRVQPRAYNFSVANHVALTIAATTIRPWWSDQETPEIQLLYSVWSVCCLKSNKGFYMHFTSSSQHITVWAIGSYSSRIHQNTST
jgi:hypothetical protein